MAAGLAAITFGSAACRSDPPGPPRAVPTGNPPPAERKPIADAARLGSLAADEVDSVELRLSDAEPTYVSFVTTDPATVERLVGELRALRPDVPAKMMIAGHVLVRLRGGDVLGPMYVGDPPGRAFIGRAYLKGDLSNLTALSRREIANIRRRYGDDWHGLPPAPAPAAPGR
jgi:hypothetical protein